MERADDRIMTQKEYDWIRMQITRLKMEQSVLGKDNSKEIKELEKQLE